MNKMEMLNGIIEENIEWFWGNDPMVDHETDISKLWDAFKVWCVQNCKEVFDNLDETIIDREVDRNYSNWMDKRIF